MSNQRLIAWIVLIGFVIVGGWYLAYYRPKVSTVVPNINDLGEIGDYIDIANTSYNIDGRDFVLVDGVATRTHNGVTLTTKIDESMTLFADISGDGIKDNIVVLVDDMPNKKVRTYVAVVVGQKDGKSFATNSVLIGEKVVIKSLSHSPAKKRMTITVFDGTEDVQLRLEIKDGKLVESKEQVKG